jgi:hypothetical protein
MIKEQLVSFEVAQLLKAKGFNVIVTDSYRANGQLRGEFKFCNYPAPTQQMAMRWLREKHDIKIEILITGNAWFYNIVTKGINGVNKIPSPAGFTYSYEDAVEALEKSIFILNHIKEKFRLNMKNIF